MCAIVVSRTTVVAQKRRVAKDVAATAHVHRVAEVAEGRADHVHRQVALKPAFAVRRGHQAFDRRQLSQTHDEEYVILK